MSASGPTWIDQLPEELGGQRAILRRLLRACESDERFRWLVVACSVGRGAADRFSDLDLGVGVADEQFDATVPEILQTVGKLGDLVDMYHHQLPGLTMRHQRIFAQFADRCQVDLVIVPVSEQLGPVRDEVVLYDPDQHRTAVFEDQAATPEQVREWAFAGWCALADLGKYLRRGSVWEAHARLNEARSAYWQLWCVGQGLPSPQYGLTSALDFGPSVLPDSASATVSDLEPAHLLAAGQNLARLLIAAGAGLPGAHQTALPQAMAAFIETDLAAVRLPAR